MAILAPTSSSKFLSYLTGWTTTIAWQAATASTTFLNATLVQALVALNYPDYNFQKWHATLIFYAIIAVALFTTTYLGRLFPKFEAIVLVLHIVGFFAILITMVYLSPKAAPSDVFGLFINGGGFSTDAQSFLVGTVSVMFNFIGMISSVFRSNHERVLTLVQELIVQLIWVRQEESYPVGLTTDKDQRRRLRMRQWLSRNP